MNRLSVGVALVIVSATVSLVTLMPVSLQAAQPPSFTAMLGAGIQRYCGDNWLTGDESDQRLYSACLREQQQALSWIRELHSRYSTQDFYRQTALPYCRESQPQGQTVNLVELSFCLDDELDGYAEIQGLRRLYGGTRVDKAAREALSSSGSWAAAARLLKRDVGLKTVRRGTTY